MRVCCLLASLFTSVESQRGVLSSRMSSQLNCPTTARNLQRFKLEVGNKTGLISEMNDACLTLHISIATFPFDLCSCTWVEPKVFD
jgi:hypothetical protein